MVKGGRTPRCGTMTRGAVMVELILHVVGIGCVGVILLVATVAIRRQIGILSVYVALNAGRSGMGAR
jgi:hypothetical protein